MKEASNVSLFKMISSLYKNARVIVDVKQ